MSLWQRNSIVRSRRSGVRSPCPALPGPAATGFTLVEVIVVTVVLSVLLLGVWSLFAMQQRTLERGQRLSRQTRVALAVQRLFQDDMARTVGRTSLPPDAISNPSNVSIASSPSNAASSSNPTNPSDLESADLGAARLASVPGAAPADPLPTDSDGEETADMVAAQFLWAGGSDWLIVDVVRPAHQWGAFQPPGAGDDADWGSTAAATLAQGSRADNLDSDSLPQRLPTPFERVIYVWLTDDEIQETTGLLFGQPTDPPGRGFGPEASGSVPVPTAGRATAADPAAGSGPPGDFARGLSTEAQGQRPRRTLLRIRTDWSWPREAESAGTTWDEAVGRSATGAAGADEPLDFALGLPGNEGSTSPARRQWLRRLLWQATGGYRQYHLHSGTALSQDAAVQPGDPADSGGESPTGSFPDQGDNGAGLLPNVRQPQVDWFPEVVAGKFQYFDGTRWQDSFSPPDESSSPGQPLPWAVRLQFEVDPRRVPQTLEAGTGPAGQGNETPSLAPNLELTAPLIDDGLDPQPGVRLDDRPEFPHLSVYTFRGRASRRDPALESDSSPLSEPAADPSPATRFNLDSATDPDSGWGDRWMESDPNPPTGFGPRPGGVPP